MVNPTRREFIRLAKRHNVIPLHQEVVVDRLTPVSVYERLQAREPHAFLLESVEGGERFGRYSFVGQRPRAVFLCHGQEVTYHEGSNTRTWRSPNPLQELKAIFSGFRPAASKELPRFWGGAVGYWGYDGVRFFERLPNAKPDVLSFPTGAFQLSGETVIFDRFSQLARVMANVYIPKHARSARSLTALYYEGVRSLERQIRRIREPSPAHRNSRTRESFTAPKASTSKQAFIHAVRRGKEYIRAGDIIQVVLSQRWVMEPRVSPFQVYRALRMVNPSPYMYCLRFPEIEIVGSSPEILVRKEATLAETRPIAGTRPRGTDEAEDAALSKDLRADPKERAEHLMLVDLGRNDLGRVCRPGSVRVPELMTIEKYSHVMHLVSSVTGELKPTANAFDLFQACFPAGTLSGAPKIRAMEIVEELEPFHRGPYGGSVGYFSYTGNMDMAITIRTLFFHRGKAVLQAGAGIVADSVPEREHRECQQKAAALVAAIRMARALE